MGLKHAKHTGLPADDSDVTFEDWDADHVIDGDVSFGDHKATDLIDPEDDQDAATKAYVDAATVGMAAIVSDMAATGGPTAGIAVVQGSGTVNADGFVRWSRAGDLLFVNFDITMQSGTEGEAGAAVVLDFSGVAGIPTFVATGPRYHPGVIRYVMAEEIPPSTPTFGTPRVASSSTIEVYRPDGSQVGTSGDISLLPGDSIEGAVVLRADLAT